MTRLDESERPANVPQHLGYRAPDPRGDAHEFLPPEDQHSCGLTLFLATIAVLGPRVIGGMALGVHWLQTSATVCAASVGVALYAGLRYGMWRVALGLAVGTLVVAGGCGFVLLLLTRA